MSKNYQTISPIRMLGSGSNSYDTPAKFLSDKNDTIHEEEYYKQRCERFQKNNKDLSQQLRILQTQNRQLKTQIQIYRQNQQSREVSPDKSFGQKNKSSQSKIQTEQVQRLLKQLRVLKNNHEMELIEHKNEQKQLHKRILELQNSLSKNIFSYKQRQSQQLNKFKENNASLQHELKQMKKSVVEYMQQRDYSNQKAEKLKSQLEELKKQINEQQKLHKQFQENKSNFDQKIYGNRQQSSSFEPPSDYHYAEDKTDFFSEYNEPNKTNNIKDQLYNIGASKSKNDKIRESKFSIQTFNGARHVPAEEAFQFSEALNNQIHRLENQLERQSILHIHQVGNLNYAVERCKKQTEQKEKDLINLLLKVKPLLLQKHKITSKQNTSPSKSKSASNEQLRQNYSKNAFGLKMLQIFLKKYKIQTF